MFHVRVFQNEQVEIRQADIKDCTVASLATKPTELIMQSDLYQTCSSLLYQYRKERLKQQGKELEMEAKGAIGAVAVCESPIEGEREL